MFKDFFSKWKLVKMLLHTQLKQTNLENRLHISTKSPKEFYDTVFEHFMDELKHCNTVMKCFCVCIQCIWLLFYILVWSFFITCIALFLFLVNLDYFSYKINLQFLIKFFRNKLFTLVIFSIIQDSLDYI